MIRKNSGTILWDRAKKIIPGGNQLLSKRSEQFLPECWPAYYSHAKGIEVWDLDENHYYDFSIMGIGACPLGYADKDVNSAVIDAVERSSMCTLNCYEEVDLAETLLSLHPWADMVRYARTGGEAAAIAIRIARAKTGRDKIAFCGYHGWHDWYLSANLADNSNLDGHLLSGLSPKGVPRGLKGTAIPFHYGNINEIEEIISHQGNEIAAIIMEPVRHHAPDLEFLAEVRRIANENGTILIFDEITSGWRMNCGGIHLLYHIYPDIALFGKAIGNGHPIAAVIGREEYMDIAQETFISSTYWTERVGFAASLATIEKMKKEDVPACLVSGGLRIEKRWKEMIQTFDLPAKVEGIAPLISLSFEGAQAMHMQTYITQEMLKKGYLAGKSVYMAYPHTPEAIDNYLAALEPIFEQIAVALLEGGLEEKLEGPVACSGFQRLT